MKIVYPQKFNHFPNIFMFDSLWDQIIAIIYQFGYGGLFLASLLENLIPPIPSEVIMPLGGFLAGTGKLNLFLVIVVCTLGSTLGNIPYYRLGRYFNKKKLTDFVVKYGKYFFTKPEYVEDLYEVFDKNDKHIVFFGRFIPGARAFIWIPAGSSRMNFWLFFWYTLSGTAVWTVFLVVLWYRLGERWEDVTKYIKEYEHIMIPLVIILWVALIGWIVWKRNKKKNRLNCEEEINKEMN